MAKQNLDDDLDDDDELDDDDLDGADDDTPLIKKLRKEKKQLERENKTLKKDQESHAEERKQNALEAAGLAELSEKKRNAILRDIEADGEEVTKESAKAAAIELGYAEDENDETEDAETRIDKATEGAKGGKGAKKITPEDVNDWDDDKRKRFYLNHRDEWEAIKRGESVVVPSFQ